MKKILVLTLASLMLVAFASVSLASTLDVNIKEGNSISLEKPNIDTDPFVITGNFGLNDSLLLSVHYVTETEAYGVGARFEFFEGLAMNLKYETEDTFFGSIDSIGIDLRAKANLTDSLALAGLIGYVQTDTPISAANTDYTTLMAQFEYSFNDFVTANLGADYTEYSNDIIDGDATTILLGVEFYPTENLTLWVDYSADADDTDLDQIGVGVKLAF